MAKVSKDVPKSDLVTIVRDQIRTAILTGRFVPGQKIVESDVARQMDVSRAPIREALRLLERQGLLVARMNAGFSIRPLDRRHVNEIYELRLILQTAAVRLAAQRITPAEFASLQRDLERKKATARAALETDHIADLVAFQVRLCEYGGNDRLTTLFSEITDDIRMILNWVGIVYQRPADILARFDDIMSALETRNEAWATAAMEGYVRRSWRETIEKLEGESGQTA